MGAAFPLLSLACTVCDSAIGREVRNGIFQEQFWPTLLSVIAPFPVLIAAVAAIHFFLPPNSNSRPDDLKDSP